MTAQVRPRRTVARGGRRIGDAVEVHVEYRSPRWRRFRRSCVASSEIAAVCNVPGAYDSRFNLWWTKRLGDVWGGNRAMSRGSRVEPLVIEDWCEEHPELRVDHVGLAQSRHRPWQVATPDGIVFEGPGAWPRGGALVGPLEVKTAGGREGWGERGTDEIPVAYRAQVLWQMDTLGASVGYVAVWIGFDYRAYVIEMDEEAQLDVAWMREQALAFLDDLAHDREPAVDGHERTAQRLRTLHPTLVDDDADVPAAVVRQFQAARRLRDAAQARMDLAENRLRSAMGDAARATVGGRKVASRSISNVAEHVRKASTRDVLRVSQPPNARKGIRP